MMSLTLDVKVVTVANGTLEKDSDGVGKSGKSVVIELLQVEVLELGIVDLKGSLKITEGVSFFDHLIVI